MKSTSLNKSATSHLSPTSSKHQKWRQDGLNMQTETPLRSAGFARRNFCTSPHARIRILRVVRVDVRLAIRRIPVHVRHVAVRIAGARGLSASIHITGALSPKPPASSRHIKLPCFFLGGPPGRAPPGGEAPPPTPNLRLAGLQRPAGTLPSA